jgi:hypothetical protein
MALLGTSFFTLNCRLEAQAAKRSGVYLTADDYQNHRLSFMGQCGSKDHGLELHDFLHKSYIHVKHDSKKQRYEKKDLFGFQACNGRDFRFVSNLEYQIVEAKDLYIYMHENWVSHGRTSQVVQEYYFSVGASGPIEALTFRNLKAAFPDNLRFLGLVASRVEDDRELAQYDKSNQTFAVNRLLLESRER